MASIRKRGNSYLLVVSMGYAPGGRRRNPQQKTVKPPTDLTPKQTEKWLQEQAMLFEMSCKKMNPDIRNCLCGGCCAVFTDVGTAFPQLFADCHLIGTCGEGEI